MPIIPKWLGFVFERPGGVPSIATDVTPTEANPFFDVIETPSEILETATLDELVQMGPPTERERVARDQKRDQELKIERDADAEREASLANARAVAVGPAEKPVSKKSEAPSEFWRDIAEEFRRASKPKEQDEEEEATFSKGMSM